MINKHRPHGILHMCTYINCLRSHLLTREKIQGGQVNCAHCIMKTRNSIDEDVHLILKQNDVTREIEKYFKKLTAWISLFPYAIL